jgi:DNA modification methylase
MGIPALFSHAMKRAGWIYRQEVIWHKMRVTESRHNRPTFSHEYLMMFTKSLSYKWHPDAVQVDRAYPRALSQKARLDGREATEKRTKDIDSVWSIPSQSVVDGIAPFPKELVRRLDLAHHRGRRPCS